MSQLCIDARGNWALLLWRARVISEEKFKR